MVLFLSEINLTRARKVRVTELLSPTEWRASTVLLGHCGGDLSVIAVYLDRIFCTNS